MNMQPTFLQEFEKLKQAPSDVDSTWLLGRRQSAMDSFAKIGLPTHHHEEWRFTNIAPLSQIGFQRSKPLAATEIVAFKESIKPFSLTSATPLELVFVDGYYAPELSSFAAPAAQKLLPKGVSVENIVSVLKNNPHALQKILGKASNDQQRAFPALNSAFMQDGAYIEVPPNIVLEQPIHLLFVSSNNKSPLIQYPRNIIKIGRGAKATVIESHVGLSDNQYCSNIVTEILLDEGAILEHNKLQQASNQAYHFSSIAVSQARSTEFTSNVILLGGKLVRNDIHVVHTGEGANSNLNGLYLGRADQHIDTQTVIDHAMPNCQSHELYKGVLDGKSHGVFSGKIIVRPDAQKIDAKQSNNNLLLSDSAVINTKPNLEIFADDVKCTHGATIGRIDAEAVFYLRSRGIPESEARNLLIFAFANQIIERIHCQPLCERLSSLVWCRLPGSRTANADGLWGLKL
jgi:Fe-S cluster assembly protein SufD